MSRISFKNLSLKGISVAVPKNTESNNDYEFSTVSEKDLFIKTTGINNRRKSFDKLCSELCYAAAERLIEQIKWEKSEISILIYVSQSRDYILPSTSIILQERLGLSKKCICFDVPLGCSGYVYGLSILAAYMTSGQIKKGLLLAGDTSSLTVNPKDKSTYPLFGDAGSATAIEWTPSGLGSWNFELGSDGSGSDYIIIPGGHCRQPITKDSLEEKEFSKGIVRHSQNLKLVGEEIFYFSVTRVPESVKEILKNSNLSFENIDYWFMHQANKLMNETIRIKMRVEKEKVPYSLQNFGNTSSASIPLTMIVTANRLNNNYRFKKILMSGFGVGLSWGNLILDTQDLTLVDLIEL